MPLVQYAWFNLRRAAGAKDYIQPWYDLAELGNPTSLVWVFISIYFFLSLVVLNWLGKKFIGKSKQIHRIYYLCINKTGKKVTRCKKRMDYSPLWRKRFFFSFAKLSYVKRSLQTCSDNDSCFKNSFSHPLPARSLEVLNTCPGELEPLTTWCNFS